MERFARHLAHLTAIGVLDCRDPMLAAAPVHEDPCPAAMPVTIPTMVPAAIAACLSGSALSMRRCTGCGCPEPGGGAPKAGRNATVQKKTTAQRKTDQRRGRTCMRDLRGTVGATGRADLSRGPVRTRTCERSGGLVGRRQPQRLAATRRCGPARSGAPTGSDADPRPARATALSRSGIVAAHHRHQPQDRGQRRQEARGPLGLVARRCGSGEDRRCPPLYALHAPEVECIGKGQGAGALRVRGAKVRP